MSFFPRQGLFHPVEGGAFVARGAVVTGDVTLGRDVGVWFGCVLRGDDAPLVIGARTNIQDLTMVHCDIGVPNVIGEDCTIGHRAILHGARVGNGCLIGMGAILLGNSEIGDECLVAAGAVVKERAQIPPRSLVVGMPAKIVRQLTDEDVRAIRASAHGYVEKLRLYL
ncbi:MAG: gamma carbonic anhydrase family protein [Planctomycetes bacterium]|nr:gamma carbonic anhydrase family protein [Planctomycetota bacterium]